MNDDDDIMEDLRAALAAAEPVPPDVVAAAKAAFSWRTIDAELAQLAELTYDSLRDDDRLVTVRGAPTEARSLTFERGDIVVELEITPAGTDHQLLGQVMAERPRGVVVERADTTRQELGLDDLGRFCTTVSGGGALRLRCQLGATDPDVITDWVTV